MKIISKTNNKRVEWIDSLRGLAMFFVVWGHTFPTNKWTIRKYIYSFHMPLFFFISGLTFNNSDKIKFKDFVQKRFKSLIIPYFIINIICYFLMIIIFNFNLYDRFGYIEDIIGIFISNDEIFYLPSNPSWFLISLFLTEILFYFLKKHSKNDFDLGKVIAICGLISYVNSISKFQFFVPFHIDTVFTGVVFYYLGYLFMKNIKKFNFIFDKKYRMFYIGIICGIIGMIVQFYNRRVSLHANLYGSITMFYISSICTIFGLILFIKLFLEKSKLMQNIGKNTIFYLAYHYIFIIIIYYYFEKYFHSNLNIFLMSLFLTLFMYPLSLFVKKYIPILIGKTKN